MTCNKTTITEKISEKNNLSPSDAKASLEALLEIIKSSLSSGEDVMITGFGKFQVQNKSTRKGRNPATGKPMTLDKRRVVTFRCAGGLRERINGKG